MRAAKNGDYRCDAAAAGRGRRCGAEAAERHHGADARPRPGPRAGAFAKDVGTEADCSQAVKLLVEHGVDVNASNDDGVTALHYAAQSGLDSVVTLLAQHGARLDVKDKRGARRSTWPGASAAAAAPAARRLYPKRTVKLLKELGRVPLDPASSDKSL